MFMDAQNLTGIRISYNVIAGCIFTIKNNEVIILIVLVCINFINTADFHKAGEFVLLCSGIGRMSAFFQLANAFFMCFSPYSFLVGVSPPWYAVPLWGAYYFF